MTPAGQTTNQLEHHYKSVREHLQSSIAECTQLQAQNAEFDKSKKRLEDDLEKSRASSSEVERLLKQVRAQW